jgi:2'-5' RNA ligase
MTMAGVRTFIAFETPGEIRQSLNAVQSRLKGAGADVRWEPDEKFHATIKFLGDIEERRLPAVLENIAQTAAPFQPFGVRYVGAGVFPDKRRPRVVWIGCENTDGRLHALKSALDDALAVLGFPAEERAFHPHITLGRIASPRGVKDLLSKLESLTFEPHSAIIDRVVVMKSTLKPQGSEYTRLTTISLTQS